MNNAIDLKSLVPSEQSLKEHTIWVNFKGVEFNIRYVSRLTLTSIADKCLVASYNAQQKQRQRTVDPVRFARGIAKAIVADWKKATLRNLANIMPLNLGELPPEKLDESVPCTEENLFMVIENAHELDSFLQDSAIDASLFRSEFAEDVEKNSSSSQSGV